MIAAQLILALALWSAPPNVHVTGGPFAVELERALAEELDAVRLVDTSSGADAIVSLEPEGTGLALSVRDAIGDLLLARTLDLDRGIDPALRMAVLLVRRTLENRPVAPPSRAEASASEAAALEPAAAPRVQPFEALPAAPPSSAAPVEPVAPPSRPPELIAAVHAGAIGPRLALGIDARYALARFHLGLTAIARGHLCCENMSNAVAAGVAETSILAGAELDLIEDPAWALGPTLAAGMAIGSAEIRALSPPFAAPGTPTDHRFLLAVVHAGAMARFVIAERWALVIAGGARFTLNPKEFRLPMAFVGTGLIEPVREGPIAPFASAGISVRLF